MTKRKLLQATAPAPHLAKFLTEALAIDVEEAKKNGTLGYMARALASQCFRTVKQRFQNSPGQIR
jgi:hypothetical protein